jgi:hypothetical protein
MYPDFTAEHAEGCCAWGGVDIIYPFPLVNATSATATSSMDYWSSPNRTDEYGLHLKLGYSQKVWAYLSADLGHIHIAQGNHTGAMRVLKAMVDNASPTLGTSCTPHAQNVANGPKTREELEHSSRIINACFLSTWSRRVRRVRNRALERQ